MYQRTKAMIKDAITKKISFNTENYTNILRAVVTFAEISVVSDMALNNLFRGFTVNTNTVTQNFFSQLILLFNKMPFEIYGENPLQLKKIIDGLRQHALKYADKNETQVPSFGFLKKKYNKIVYRG